MSRPDRERGLEQAAEELREKLGWFASRPRFDDELEEAFDHYFGRDAGDVETSLDEGDFKRFMEWFIHDYRLSHGHRLIEVFDLEHGAGLAAPGRELLRGWMGAHLTLLELIEERGGAWTCVDLLTGARLGAVRFAGDPPLRWSIVYGRPLPVGDGYEVSEAAARLAPSAKEMLLEHLRGEYRRFRLERRGAPVSEFLRENGYCINDLLATLAEWMAVARAQDEQAHRIVSGRAIYKLRDPEKVAARLLAYDDTQEVRPGRLYVRDKAGTKGRVLAEIRLTNGRMHVRCWSPERLEQSKRLLAQRLQGLARHLLDAYEEYSLRPPGAAAASNGALPAPGRDACAELVERWLERPHPALNGQPPKRLAGSPLGRLRIAELLKRMEYYEHGNPGDVGARAVRELRRRLDLGEDVGVVFPLDALPEHWNRKSEETVLDEFVRVAIKELAPEHLSSAAWMWWNFCSLAFPVIRKPRVWAAALHYCVGLVENWQPRREEIAARYGVSANALSHNAWRIIDVLYLQPYDDRYTVYAPIQGLIKRLGPPATATAEPRARDLAATLAKAARLREAVAREAVEINPSLRQRAYAFFASHVGARQAAQWEEMFLDWYHFDYRVPVMGGRTFIEQAFLFGDLGESETDVLMGWIGRHPAFYVVEGVGRGDERGPGARLSLVGLMDQKLIEVDWLRLSQPIVPGDVVFARIVPVDDLMVSMGVVVAFPARYRESIRNALLEDRALVERWNGKTLTWYEFGALYAERLYALALRGVDEAGVDLYDD